MPTYTGVYQAKATKVTGLSIEALIPQVFGEAPVIVQRFMGSPPSKVGTGWVTFVGGNPEFPVWCSGVTTNITNVTTGENGESIYITRDYRWVNQVMAGDPGNGKVKVDSYDPEGASEMYISIYDQNAEANLMLLSLTAGDLLAVYLSGDVHTRIEYTLAGPPVNNTGWFTIPLEPDPVNYGFSTSTPSNNAQVKVTVQTVSGGGGGGGTGTDEVWVGTADPIAAHPTIELWFDSDDDFPTGQTPTTSAGNALGIVASAPPLGNTYITAGPSPVPTGGVACTASVTFTFQVGRRYRISMGIAGANLVGGAATGINYLVLDSANAGVGDGDLWLMVPTTNYQGGFLVTNLNGDGTTKTIRAVVYAISGTGNTVGSYVKSLYIEDVGPNSSPALPISETPPAWIPVTFQNSWAQAAGHPVCAYRKIGDLVFLRGAMSGAAATLNTSAFNLPPGFRPPGNVGFITTFAAQGFGNINIDSSGGVVPQYGNKDFCSINLPPFSVTP